MNRVFPSSLNMIRLWNLLAVPYAGVMTDDHDDYIRLMQAQMEEMKAASAESGRASMLYLERVMCDKFRMLREERGWSQKDLAEKVREYGFDFHQSTIAKLESGARPLRVAEMYALSHVFRIPPGAVFFMAYSTPEEDDGLDPFDSLTRLLAQQEEGRAYMRTMMLEQMAQTVDIIADYQTRMNSIVDAMRRIAATEPSLADVIADVEARHPRREKREKAADLLEWGAEVTDVIRGGNPDGKHQTEE